MLDIESCIALPELSKEEEAMAAFSRRWLVAASIATVGVALAGCS